MKVVAVSQRVEVSPGRGERCDVLDQRLCTWLSIAGYLPVPVPNILSISLITDRDNHWARLQSWLKTVRPQAVVLSGGNDLGECPDRDSTEECLLAWARDGLNPVLGICRGMQMMAVWSGVQLKPIDRHVNTRHRLIGKITGEVNSFHKFGLTGCPKDFEVLATTEDGDLEAIRHSVLPWEGWMWHPEREANLERRDLERLKALLGE
ncbi:MAG: gamma-glutamyl-gamma-aminobutyrate hydrolase family protein [Gammaproteobacteria bacterium]|nr:gamma-glutamyl-gamma-aminobutyrate hydrolase family protein [Gammaproteobacteria bacterium]